jgi:glucokinase
VSLERVLSGEGLCVLARFMAREAGENGGAVPASAEEVTRRAREGTCPHCVKAAEAFVRILAREAGHLALTFLPRDGVVLGGGIPPALLPFLHSEDFGRALLDQGRFSPWMEKVPVSVVLDPAAALLGAAVLAGRVLE